MAKWTRTIVGDVLKDKSDPKRSYIKIKNDVSLNAGDYLNLESKQSQLDGIKKAFEEGKVNEEIFEAATERINKMPDFVMFTVVKLTKN